MLVTGAAGRIGGILRAAWGDDAAIWQSRGCRPGFFDWDMMAQPWAGPSLSGSVIVNLAGVTSGAALDDNIALARAALDLGAAQGAAHLFLFLKYLCHILVYCVDTPLAPFVLYEGEGIFYPYIAAALFQPVYDLPAAGA